MSQVVNTVLTHYRASAGNTVAVSQSVARGFGSIGRSINETSRMSERLNNQWRAIGTTFRYAIAGSAVFGTAALVTNLKDLQRQMGLIQALGDAKGGIFPNTGIGMIEMLKGARQEAVRSVTPIAQFNEGLINLFSSVQNVPENQAAKWMGEISLAAQYAQTDSDTASKAVTGLMNAFNLAPNFTNIQRITRSITELIGTVPGGRAQGGQILQQFPQLAAAFQLGRGTPEQSLGYYQTLLRSGGSPATAARGLQYLLQTVSAPEDQTKESVRTLRKMGIDNDFVNQYGGSAAVAKIIANIRGRVSITKKGAKLSNDDLDGLFPDGIASLQQMRDLGISGEGLTDLQKAIPRIHGVRALVLLASGIERTNKDLNAQFEAYNGTGNALKKHNDRMKNLVDPQQLAKAQIAMQGITQQLSLAMQPFLNLTARGITRVGEFTNDHEDGTEKAMRVGLAGVGLFGAARFLRGGKGLFGKGLVGGIAARDAAANGGAGPGMSPQNPLYVIVVGKLFGGAVIGSDSESLPGKAGIGKRIMDALTKSGLGAGALRVGGGVAKGGVAMGAAYEATNLFWRSIGMPEMQIKPDFGHARDTIAGFGKKMAAPDFTRQELIRNRFGPNASGGWNPAVGTFKGKGEVWMTIDLNHPNGKKEQRRVHVPLDLWERGKTPSTTGRAGSTRSGGR